MYSYVKFTASKGDNMPTLPGALQRGAHDPQQVALEVCEPRDGASEPRSMPSETTIPAVLAAWAQDAPSQIFIEEWDARQHDMQHEKQRCMTSSGFVPFLLPVRSIPSISRRSCAR